MIIEEGPCVWYDRDEGRAMIEIIHDVAPGAQHAFATADGGQANFAQGILALAGVGANVINDDITYLFEPFYQDGIIAQAIDLVKARGVSYFSSAGNDARQAYEAPFRPSGQFFDIGLGLGEAHDFDPGPGVDVCQKYTLSQDDNVVFLYQWDQPFFSVSGPPGSASDMDLVLSTPDCDLNLLLYASVAGNIGSDPLEWIEQRDAVNNKFGMMLLRMSGPAPGRMKVVVTSARPGSFKFDEFDTKTGASWGHSAARGGLGLGAAPWHRTPVFGVAPPVMEDFSSAAGTPILFDTAGKRLPAAQVREQPAITAPDGVDTVSFGVFFGTSAAAPHAAGVAALMKDLVPTLTPTATYAALKRTAIDMDDPSTSRFDKGFDFGTGFGLIQADKALNAVAPEPKPIPPVIPPTEPPEPPVEPPEPLPPISPDVPAPTPVEPPPPLPPPSPVAPFPPRSDLCGGLPATIVGTDGRDFIVGIPGPDVIHGLSGNDVILGLAGNDVICGGPGKDRIFGGLGRDKLFGEAGRDRLNGGPGRDRCRGGSGFDGGLRCESFR
jgi:subtilisin family serine protease